MFATAGWDGYMRVYSLNEAGIGYLQLQFKVFLGDSALTLAWDEDSNVIFVGLADGNVKAVELSTGNIQGIMQLSSPICKIFWESKNKYLIVIPFATSFIISQFGPPVQKIVDIG